MPSTEFNQRMESVLAARVAARSEAERPRARRTRHVAGALVGAIVVFFVLKAVALVTTGLPYAAAGASESGLSADLSTWVAGADPVTRLIALAVRPAAAR